MNYCQDILYNKTSYALQAFCKVSLNVETISELLQRRLKDLKMSKAALAQKVGVSRTYIGDLTNRTAKTKSGFYRPNPEIVTKLAKALQVTEIEILNAIGYSQPSETESESIEVLDGVTVQLQKKKLTKAEREELLEAMRIVAAGVRARHKKEKQE
jgi:Helix-turn-helix.